MRKLQSILLATDFSLASREAISVAQRLAAQFGSHITLLHVMGATESFPALAHQYRDAMTSQLREVAETLSGRGVLIDETTIQAGHPADSIVRKAEEIDADLILLGAGDQSQSPYTHLGPVAAAVVQHAARPVLAIRPGSPAVRFARILCPVDMSAPSARGLANGIQLARMFQGHVIVLTVIPPLHWLTTVTQTAGLTEAAALHERDWRRDFDQFLEACGFGDISWEKHILHGPAHQGIIETAKRHEADLLVMGSTGRTGLARILLGSVTRRVMQQLPCSLLTVKQQNVIEELHDDEIQTIKVLYAQAQALLEARSYEAALDKYNHVLLRDPFHTRALAGKADTLDALGRPDEAERCRRRARVLEQHDEPPVAAGIR